MNTGMQSGHNETTTARRTIRGRGRRGRLLAAVGLFAFNVIALPTYSGLYDKFLIVVGLGWNAATAWLAWTSYP